MVSKLEEALSIALKAHSGQCDKAQQPYILHPLRLMLKFEEENLKIIAVLHDFIEDSEFTIEDLERHGFSDEVLSAIDCLTKRKSESYENFITRILSNKLAKEVKVEDIT